MGCSTLTKDDLVQSVLRELDVAKKARDSGRLGHPPADSVTPDAAHQEIIAHFSGRLRDCRGQLEKDLAKLQADRKATSAKIDIEQTRDAFSTLTNAVNPEVQALKQKQWDAVERAKKVEERAARNLRWYQREHDLLDDAHYPESPLQHFASVAAIAVLEWIALSAFYAEGSDYGLLGGVLIAMALSVVNISLAILTGSLLRYFNHRSATRKVLAALGVLFLVSCFVVTTLAAAHYRVATNEMAAVESDAQMQQGATAPKPAVQSEQWRAAKLAGQRFAAHPFGFEDVLSWILIVAAVVFGIFAAYKGYRIDDPYPGYGHRDRMYRQRGKEFEQLRQAYVHQLEEFFSRTRGQQQALLSGIRREVEYFQQKCSESEGKATLYRDAAERVKESCNVVIKSYREENTSVAGLPRPSYFEQPIQLDERLLTLLKALSDEEIEMLRRYQQALREFSDLAQRNDKFLQDRRAEELARLDGSFEDLQRRVREDINRETPLPPNSR